MTTEQMCSRSSSLAPSRGKLYLIDIHGFFVGFIVYLQFHIICINKK